MLPTQRDQHGKPTTSVKGGFPVHFHYTAGVAAEKVFYGLKDKKFLASTCDACEVTYFPGKMFCEQCFDELDEGTWSELETTGTLFSFTEVFHGHDGEPLDDPYYIGLVEVTGSDTKFFHRLIDVDNPEVGMTVNAVWEDDREGSLMDLKGFTSV